MTNKVLDLEEIRARETAISSISIEKRAKIQRIALEYEEFKEYLPHLYSLCPWCLIYSPEASNEHLLPKCQSEGSKESRGLFFTLVRFFRDKKVISNFSACFHCFLPQELCERFTLKPGGGYSYSRDKRCTYPDFLPAYFAVSLSLEINDLGYTKRLEEASLTRGNKEEEASYLGEKIVYGDIETNRLFVEFLTGLQGILDRYKELKEASR